MTAPIDPLRTATASHNTTTPPRLPQLDDFEVLRQLGQGGMGIVYLARQLSLPRQVALKTLSEDRLGESDLARFLREAEVVAELAHPNVVQVYQLGTWDGRPYFAMEFCAGGSLAERLAGQPQSAAEAASVVSVLARAVHFAHQRGVIHRDLKPANVLLTADGTLKVSDFGLARRQQMPALTSTGAIVGTPSYLSPEQASQASQGGPASDIWALGVMLYEMLTGRVPFRAANAVETLLLVCSQEAVPPRLLQPGVPRDLETICLKCLEKEPEKRYGSADDLADDLDRFRAGQPTLARPAGRLRKAAKWARRHPARAALAVVSVLSLALLLGLSLAFTVLFQGERNEAVRQKNDADDQRRLAENRLDANQKLTFQAQQSEARALDQLTLSRHHLMTAQMLRASAVVGTEPGRAIPLLEDCTACPLDLRDFSWRYLYRQARRDRHVMTVPRTTGRALTLTFSGDSRLLAARGSIATTVSVWDVQTGAVVKTLSADGAYFRTLAFSLDGKTLAAGVSRGKDGEVHLWDTQSWQSRKVALPAIPVDLAFHPKGESVAVVDPKSDVHTIDVRTAKLRGTRPAPAAIRGKGSPVRVSPDGEMLFWFGAAPRTAQLWRAGQDKPIMTDPAAEAAFFTPDGKHYVVAGRGKDQTSQLWLYDLANGSDREFATGKTPPAQLALDTRAGLLAEPRVDSSQVALRDLSTGNVRLLLDVEPALDRPAYFPLALAPDGRTLASASGELVILWDLRPDIPRRQFTPTPLQRPDSIAFRPDGSTWVLGREGTSVRASNLMTGKETLSLPTGDDPIYAIEMAADGRTLFTTTAPQEPVPDKPGDSRQIGVLHVWDVTTRQRRHSLRHEGVLTHPLVVTPDNKIVVTNCYTQGKDPATAIVRAWDLATGKPIWEWRKDTNTVGGASRVCRQPGRDRLAVITSRFLKEGNQFANTITFLDLNTGRELGSLEGGNSVTGLQYSPDGRWLAAPGRQGFMQLHGDSGPGPEFPGYSTAVPFSPDSRLLAVSAGSPPSVRLHDVLTGQERAVIPENGAPVAFTADGRSLICRRAGESGFNVWDIPVGPELVRWNISYPTSAVAISPDGQTLACSVSSPGDVHGIMLLDRTTGRERRRLPTEGVYVTRISFSPDGRRLMTSGLHHQGDNRITSVFSVRETDTGRTVAERRVEGYALFSTAWRADGATITWTGGDTKTGRTRGARLEMATGESRPLFTDLPEGQSVLLGRDAARHVVLDEKRGRVVVSEAGGKVLGTWTGFIAPFRAELSPDGRLLATVDWKERDAPSRLRLWDVASGKMLHEWPSLPGDVGWRLTFSPDGRLLASSNNIGTVRLWSLVEGRELATWQAHTQNISTMTFSADGKELLTSGDKWLKLWPVPPR